MAEGAIRRIELVPIAEERLPADAIFVRHPDAPDPAPPAGRALQALVCGGCQRTLVLLGERDRMTGLVHECERCGALNVLPEERPPDLGGPSTP